MKIGKLNIIVCAFSVVFFLLSTFAVAQKKESGEMHKTRSSATINGIKYYLHTVEKGQTLFAIAKFYGQDVNDIIIENPEAIDGISPGQVLKIKVEKNKPSELTKNDSANYILHKVEKGQTLYAISKQHGVSQEKIKALNPELKDGLKDGQILKIPSVKIVKSAADVKPAVPAVTDAADRNYLGYNNYKGEKKDEYNIAFFLPFNTVEASAPDQENNKGETQFSTKTTVALQFYQGVLLAIDSLKKQHLNAKLFIYDIDDTDSANVIKILKKPEMAAMDLMVGPLYGSKFMPIANFAKEHEIPIVSPFTQANKILFNNPYVIKVTPSTTLQIEQMAHYVVDSFKTQNLILVNNSNEKEVSFFNAFKNAANADLIKAGKPSSDSVKIAKGFAGIQNLLSSFKKNVIILPSNNQAFVTEFISQLNGIDDKYKIVLFGLQSWENFDNLDFEYLNNLSLHTPSNTFIDYRKSTTENFVRNYRVKYKTEPKVYAFNGFDITYFFVSRLQKEGTGFLKTLSENNYSGIAGRYQFFQFPADSGFENKFVYILKFQDYQLKKAN